MPKISQLPTDQTPTADDYIATVDNASGATKKISISELPSIVLPSGMISPYGGSISPNGWLICDGSAVSRSTYANLFTTIGTAYGIGDGSSTFNLPNLTGKVPVGKNSGTFTPLGATGGEERHTLTTGEIPAHQHGIQSEFGTNASLSIGDPGQYNQVSSTSGRYHTNYTQADGGTGGSHNNLQPYQVVNYIIKT